MLSAVSALRFVNTRYAATVSHHLLIIASCGCSVAEDVGDHQLERLVEMLTSWECEDLLLALSHPEENVFQHVERLSPEKNELHLQQRAKRDVSFDVG